MCSCFFFFFKQKTAYEIMPSLVGSEMCIRDSFGTSALFSLAVASVHGIEVDDVARRRTLLLASVLGVAGAELVQVEAGIPTSAWARALLTSAPSGTCLLYTSPSPR